MWITEWDEATDVLRMRGDDANRDGSGFRPKVTHQCPSPATTVYNESFESLIRQAPTPIRTSPE